MQIVVRQNVLFDYTCVGVHAADQHLSAYERSYSV